MRSALRRELMHELLGPCEQGSRPLARITLSLVYGCTHVTSGCGRLSGLCRNMSAGFAVKRSPMTSPESGTAMTSRSAYNQRCSDSVSALRRILPPIGSGSGFVHRRKSRSISQGNSAATVHRLAARKPARDRCEREHVLWCARETLVPNSVLSVMSRMRTPRPKSDFLDDPKRKDSQDSHTRSPQPDLDSVIDPKAAFPLQRAVPRLVPLPKT